MQRKEAEPKVTNEEVFERQYRHTDIQDNDEVLELTPVQTNAADDLDETIDHTFLSIFASLSKMSLPMALCYTLTIELIAISFMLTNLSTSQEELASISMIMTLMNVLVFIGVIPLLGMGFQLNDKLGELMRLEENNATADEIAAKRKVIAESLKAGIIVGGFSLAATIPLACFSKEILMAAMGQQAVIAELTENFFRHFYAITFPGTTLAIMTSQIMMSFQQFGAGILISAGSLAAGVTLAGLLGFNVLHSAVSGREGVTVGFIVTDYVAALSYSLFLYFNKVFNDYRFFDFTHNTRAILHQVVAILKYGVPMALTSFAKIANDLIFASVAGIIGETEQAAISAGFQLSVFNLLINVAFTESIQQYMTRLIGYGKLANAHRFGLYGLMTNALVTAPLPIICASYPRVLLLTVQNDVQAVNDLLTKLAPLIATNVWLQGNIYTILQSSRAVGDHAIPTAIGVGGTVLSAVASSLVGAKTNLGIFGMVGLDTALVALGGTLLLLRWRKQIRPEMIRERREATPTSCIATLFSCCKKDGYKELDNIKSSDVTPSYH